MAELTGNQAEQPSLDVVDACLYTPTGIVVRGVMEIRNGRIRSVLPLDEWNRGTRDSVTVFDAGGRTVIPGFVDVHVHGGGGFDAMSGKASELEGMSDYHASKGTTSFLATTITAGREELMQAIRVIRDTIGQGTPGAQLLGIHLEGPYLNAKRAGAQNPEHIRAVDTVEIQQYWEASGGHLRLITLAPEYPEAMDSIRWLRERGVTVSAGHTDANYMTMKEAVGAGLTHVTHLFNGMRPLHHREPGVAGAALMLDPLHVELICDGIHIHPELVHYVWRTKMRSRIIAITDCIPASGLPDGPYDLGGLPAFMQEGVLRLQTEDGSEGSLAGSTLSMERALGNLRQWTGASLAEVLVAFTENPARQAGFQSSKGALAPGKDADFVVLDADERVSETWVRGKCVYLK